jgi:hypothetical protein
MFQPNCNKKKGRKGERETWIEEGDQRGPVGPVGQPLQLQVTACAGRGTDGPILEVSRSECQSCTF